MAAGILVLVALVLWLTSSLLVSTVVERQLRHAGYADASVAGVSLALPAITIDELRLAPADAFVLDGIRVQIGTGGIERIDIERLRIEIELNADGTLVIPGSDRSGDGELPLDLLPDRGVQVANAELHLANVGGDESAIVLSGTTMQPQTGGATLSADFVVNYASADLAGAATAQIASDGTAHASLEVTRGQFELSVLGASNVTGNVTADLSPRGSPAIAVNLQSRGTMLSDLPLGTLAIQADWRDGIAEFGIASMDTEAVDISADGRVELTPDGTGVSGHIELTGRRAAVPNLFREGSIAIAASIEGDRNRLRLTASNDWTASLTPDAALLPETMRVLEREQISIAMAARAEQPLVLELALADKFATLETSVRVRAGDSRFSAAAIYTANWSAEDLAVTADALSLAAGNLPWDALVLGFDDFEGAASFSANAWRLDGTGTLRATGSLGKATIDGFSANWSGTVTGDSETIGADATECIEWDIAAFEWDLRQVEQLSPPCIQSVEDDRLLAHEFDSGRTRFAIATAAKPLSIELMSAGEATAIDGTWPALRISGTASSGGVDSLNAEVSGGALSVSTRNLSIAGVDGSAEMRGNQVVSAALTVAAIESLATPALWAPVSLEASAVGGDGALAFEALLSDELGILVVEASGEHVDGQGSSSVKLYPIQFITGATEVRDLSPLLAESVTGASGNLGFDGQLMWGPDGVTSSGELDIRNFGATIFEVTVAGVNAMIGLDSLLPPATMPNQRMQIALIDPGVRLENGTVVYGLETDGQLDVQQMEFDLAGGRVYSEPFIIDSLEMRNTEIVLHAEEVELSQVLELSRIDGLEGTGILSGSVPIGISSQGLQFDDGELAAETDGTLRYTPENVPSFLRGDDVRSRMLREALTNFQYDELSLNVASESGEGGEQRLTLSANGANPDFLEGHPIEINFNLRGSLLGAMRSVVGVSGAGDIEDMFDEQERGNLETTQ